MSGANVQHLITEIQTGQSSAARTAAADRLERAMRDTEPKSMDDATLDKLISLLNSNDESVRASVAAALGHLGPRVRKAIPKLESILPQDCLVFGQSSSGAIRLAIQRMGAVPPPVPPCHEK